MGKRRFFLVAEIIRSIWVLTLPRLGARRSIQLDLSGAAFRRVAGAALCIFLARLHPMDHPLSEDRNDNNPLENQVAAACQRAANKVSIPLTEAVGWFQDSITRFQQGDGYLSGGTPGCGKSLLQTQIGIDLAHRERVGYLLTEEPEASHRARISAMLSERDAAEASLVHSNVVVEDGLTNIELLPDFVASQILRPSGRFHGVRVLFIDSVMGQGIPATPGRRWERIYQGLRLCHQAGVTTFGNVHLNKSNSIAGPMTLRHNCDCLLLMRQLGNHRLLYVLKNRNGIADQRRPARLVIDPVTLMLRPAPMAEPLAVCARTYLSGTGEVEMQTAISLSLGSRRRIVCGNIAHGEIEQLVDMICQIPGIDLNDLDFSISCRIPGARGYWPTLGLALCISLIGSAQQRVVADGLLFLGEIDLMRRVRDVPDSMATEIANALIAGAIRQPVKIVCSPGTASLLTSSGNVQCAACRTVDEAVFAVWPQTR
jgi:predicted ATP-dependent serine protease